DCVHVSALGWQSQSQAGGRGPVFSGGHRGVNLCLPGSSALRGPGAVQGWEQELLTVECRYDPDYENHRKWWCRGAAWLSCRILVQTGSEQEVRRGHVSIRDHQKNHTFTVTVEELRLDDADTYWCGIDRAGTDLGTRVKVTVERAPTVSTTTASTTAAITSPIAPVTPEEGNGPPSKRELLLFLTVAVVLLIILTTALRLALMGTFRKEDVSYAVLSLGALGQEPTYVNTDQKMRDKVVCLFPALLLLMVPGSSALRGPGAVQGWEQGSLTVGCWYDPGYENYRKILVQTTGSEQEMKWGRMSIREHHKARMFIVTMEELRLDDADTYWCGIEKAGTDLGDQVTVTVNQEVPVKVTADPGKSM
ncbi:CMRF35-like molecule 7, partial [Galemys pyrenaicus]